MGDSQAILARATELLGAKIQHVERAPLYRSKAFGYTDQPDFINTVVRGETSLDVHKLLSFVKQIEQELGRVERFRWGPREIDIDIIFYGHEQIESADITVPHPGLRERSFVLQPLCDLAPEWVDPASGQTVEQLLAALPPHDLQKLSA